MPKLTLQLSEQIKAELLSEKGLDASKLDGVLSALVISSDERASLRRYLAGQTEEVVPTQVLVLRFNCPGLLGSWIQEVGCGISNVEHMEIKHHMQDVLEAAIQFALFVFSTGSEQGEAIFADELHQRVTNGKRLSFRLQQAHELFLGHSLELEGFFAYLESAYPKLAKKLPSRAPVVLQAPELTEDFEGEDVLLFPEVDKEVVVPLNQVLVLWVLFWALKWNTTPQVVLEACLGTARFVYSHVLKEPGASLGTFREELLLGYASIRRRRIRLLGVVSALEKAFVEDQATDRYNMEAVRSLLNSGREGVVERLRLRALN